MRNSSTSTSNQKDRNVIQFLSNEPSRKKPPLRTQVISRLIEHVIRQKCATRRLVIANDSVQHCGVPRRKGSHIIRVVQYERKRFTIATAFCETE